MCWGKLFRRDTPIFVQALILWFVTTPFGAKPLELEKGKGENSHYFELLRLVEQI